MKSGVRIDEERLYRSLSDLGAIGSYDCDRTGLKGVNRLALTDNDKLGRQQVVRWMQELGLTVTVDRIGNVYARRAGTEDHLAPVMSGSHIDSVPTAGRFDGCLGVLGALEVVRTLNDHRIPTRRPLVVAFFTDEEGCRFGTDMLGSAVATGRIPLEDAYALKDAEGFTVKAELERIGFLGTAPEVIAAPHAYVECHIEQGPILRAQNLDLGVVTGVQAISWQELTITGKSAHAGTTPMELRRDPLVAAARITCHLRDMIRSGNYGPGMRATVGAFRPHPGLVNIVPSRVVCSVDLRNPIDALMKKSEDDLAAYYQQVAKDEGVEIASRQTARTELVQFETSVQSAIAESAERAGLKFDRIISGAGHDAQEMARLCKTAMIFVPGEYEGISHNPREYSSPRQCSDGVNVLYEVMTRLADEP